MGRHPAQPELVEAVRLLRAEIGDLRAEVTGLRAEMAVLRDSAARQAVLREANDRDRGARPDALERRAVPRPTERNRVIELPRDVPARVG